MSALWRFFFKARRDRTGGHFPNCQDRDKTTYVWSCCSDNSGKIWEKFGTVRDYSIPLGKFLNGLEMMQKKISLVLFGLVLYYYFQYQTRKFPTSTEFKEFWELKYKISNSGIPVSFLGLIRDGNGGNKRE